MIPAAMMMVFAALTAVPVATKTQAAKEVRTVRFVTPRFMVSRAHADSRNAYICGKLRVDMSFAKARVTKPVLRIACLCDVDGSLVCYKGLWDRPNTYTKMSRSEVSKAIKDSGIKITSENRDSAREDLSLFTPYLSQIAADGYSACVYGETGLNHGFFRVDRVFSHVRLLLFRLEIWQNGSMVGSHESSHSGLGKYELPDDWHIWKKYPQKFQYVDTD